jgi:predicted anti-sigma-YlaC factor YlaD
MAHLRHILAKIVFGVTPPCDEMTVLLSKSLDTPSSFTERLQTELHLSLCPSCRRVQTQFDVLHEMMRQLLEDAPKTPAEQPSAYTRPAYSALTLPEEAKQRLQARINQELHHSNGK